MRILSNVSGDLASLRLLRLILWAAVVVAYAGITGLVLLDHYVRSQPWETAVINHIGGYFLTAAVAGAVFSLGMRLRKRTVYPHVVLMRISAEETLEDGAAAALRTINQLLKTQASLILLSQPDGDHVVAGCEGMPVSAALDIATDHEPLIQEALEADRVAVTSLAGDLEGSATKLIVLPVRPLHKQFGVLCVVADRLTADIKDRELMAEVARACGLALQNLQQKEALVESERRLMADVEELKRAEETVRKLAYHDPLTGLANRTLFVDRVNQLLKMARRSSAGGAVMFLDLDNFKVVNDSMGHTFGDELLVRVGQRIAGAVRDEDTVARVGGDEFAVLLPRVDHTRYAIAAAERLLEALGKPFELKGQEFTLTGSIGICLYPEGGSSSDDLLSKADMAMYRAKERGRNQCQLYAPEIGSQAIERLALETSLRLGLERGDFVVYYQPLVDVASLRLVGVEALVRWRHPDGRLVPPGDFMEVAEQSSLIIPLGEWVLRTACAQTKAWRQAGLPLLRMSVNLSVRQFRQRHLTDSITRALRDTGADPAQLQLEITEGAAMQDVEFAAAALRDLRGNGIRTAIDDFGTGYSSLSYLKNLPLDVIKIDSSFMRNLAQDAKDAAIVRAIIAMGHSMNLSVVAEGVETPEQLAFLKAEGCDEFQGYLFSEAVPERRLTTLLTNEKQKLSAQIP